MKTISLLTFLASSALAADWVNISDPVTARGLVAVMDGICLQVLLTGGDYDEAYTRDLLGRVFNSAGSAVS